MHKHNHTQIHESRARFKTSNNTLIHIQSVFVEGGPVTIHIQDAPQPLSSICLLYRRAKRTQTLVKIMDIHRKGQEITGKFQEICLKGTNSWKRKRNPWDDLTKSWKNWRNPCYTLGDPWKKQGNPRKIKKMQRKVQNIQTEVQEISRQVKKILRNG